MELVHWLFLAAIVFFAGVIRGCIGFGFSALVVAASSLFINPKLVVPLVALLEIFASIHMAASVYKQAQLKPLSYLLLGTLISTPIGVLLLILLPAQEIRLILSLIILIMSVLLLSGWQYQGKVAMPSFFTVGAVAGACNGAAGIGGLPVATFLATIKLSMTELRATLVLYFFVADLIFILSAVLFSSFTGESDTPSLYSEFILLLALSMLIPLVIGIQLGGKLFVKLNEKTLRRAVILFLLFLSLVGILRVILS